MDIDVVKTDLNGLMEDDVIDFDTDMVDSNQDLQKHDNNLEVVDNEMQEDGDVVNLHAFERNGMASEDVDFDLHDAQDIAHSPEDVDFEVSEDAPESQPQEPLPKTQSLNGDNQGQENLEDLNKGDHSGDTVPDDHASSHEIDYEFEDNAERDESHKNVTEDATHPTESRTEAAVSPDSDHGSPKTVNDIAAPEQDASEPTRDERDAPSHDDKYEPQNQQGVTLEHEEETEFDGVEAEDVTAPEYNEDVDASDNNEEDREEEHAGSQEETAPFTRGPEDEIARDAEGTVDHEYDEGEPGPETYSEEGATDPAHANYPATNEGPDGKADEFPAITVQYKGDEFPFFSTTINGFFTDISILDEPLEKLLAGFRSELENEIADDDDLIFQIDELGLEIAEAAQGELMTNVTFRQILEIFDLLVKNQDPESSRTLYTYLFTKPNTEKRLESLIESATAGKGLDEVIHLFETPMNAVTGMLETSATIDGVHDELDEFDSPIDEEHLDEADGVADDQYPQDEHLEDKQFGDEQQEDEQPEDEQPEDEQPEDEQPEDEQPEDEQPEDDDLLQDEPTHPDDAAPKDQEVADYEADGKEADGYDGHQVTAETLNEIQVDAPTIQANLGAAGQTDTVADVDGLEQNAHADSEIDPFVNLELDEDAELNNDVVIEEKTEAIVGVSVETDEACAQTVDTTTTTTLQEEEEAASFHVDLGATSPEAEMDEKAVSGENDLDEIDWRDEPEADDQEPTTPSAAGKRSRGDDDEIGAEDEQDAKRRRP
ncbi:hypothetical protein FHETE_10045 [Fusarium heterosporum]|uniref:Uncharacterized protein n=1 Tax=Fusarium heterosporum TaxID=42747 RepID=A0A8H5WH89_FUSHE|nr:hypothetical protein FHETE_10045 [Fusarium heterosporum]